MHGDKIEGVVKNRVSKYFRQGQGPPPPPPFKSPEILYCVKTKH